MNFNQSFKKWQEEVDKRTCEFLDREIELAEKAAPEALIFIRKAKSFILRRKKDSKLFLAYLGYFGFNKKRADKFLDVGVALKLIYNFSLIHYQLIKQSVSSREKNLFSIYSSIYEKDPTKKDFKHFGYSQSIVVGDIVSGWGYKRIIDSGFKSKLKLEGLNRLNKIVAWMQRQELKEVLWGTKNFISQEDIAELNFYKIKSQFEGPLLLGITFSNQRKKHFKFLSEFAQLIGQISILKNDLRIINSKEKDFINQVIYFSSKDILKNLLVFTAYQLSGKKDKEIFKKIFKKEEISVNDIKKIKILITKLNLVDYYRKIIKNLTAQAKKLIVDSNLPNQEQESLSCLIKEL